MVVAPTHLLAALLALGTLVDSSLASAVPDELATSSSDSASLESAFSSLNATVGGRLKRAVPFEAPCFSMVEGQSVQADTAACSAIQASYTDPTFRVTHFGAYMLVSPHFRLCMCFCGRGEYFGCGRRVSSFVEVLEHGNYGRP